MSDLLRSNPAQQERLSHIDFRANFLGTVGRNDLISRFGIKEAAATRDIAEYRKLAPDNLIYDGLLKKYVRADTFKSLFEHSASQVLTALAKGFGEDFVGKEKAFITCEAPTRQNDPSLKILSVLSRAIHQTRVATIKYLSLGSGESCREIVPFALIDNGLRWHVRAFDRKRNLFADFVATRIVEADIMESEIKANETRDADIQWNRIVELELKAHPRLAHPEAIELDYGMQEGLLKLNIRAAVTGYLLRLWNVDCSENHSLESDEFHLWLQNSRALYGVQNIFLAPGYVDNK